MICREQYKLQCELVGRIQSSLEAEAVIATVEARQREIFAVRANVAQLALAHAREEFWAHVRRHGCDKPAFAEGERRASFGI